MSAQTPTVGRVVHYYAHRLDDVPGPGPFAADIVHVHEKSATVDLLVKFPRSTHNVEFFPDVLFSETPKPGHWSWPPRVG